MESILSHCSASFAGNSGMFAVFFLGGLAGSLTHCLAMCGPVVACQAACGGACGNKLSGSAQTHYHLGRFITYGALGFASSFISASVAGESFWPLLSDILLAVAGVVFVLSAVVPGSHFMFKAAPTNSFLRGVLMSFMPCGLIYAALMAAAVLANPFAGMVAMWLFVLGTLPLLVFASSGAAALAGRWHKLIGGVGRFGMAFNGLVLLAMAARIVR